MDPIAVDTADHHWPWTIDHDDFDDAMLKSSASYSLPFLSHTDSTYLPGTQYAALPIDSEQSAPRTGGSLDTSVADLFLQPQGQLQKRGITQPKMPRLNKGTRTAASDWTSCIFDAPPPALSLSCHDGGVNTLDLLGQSAAVATPMSQYARNTRNKLRRQYRACDPCRVSKRRCDLSRNAKIRNGASINPCSLCDARDITCTVQWLVQKSVIQEHASADIIAAAAEESLSSNIQPASASPHRFITQKPQSCPLLTLQETLSRTAVAQMVCLQKFNLYVDISDTLLSHCLVAGSLPDHYKFGIAAYEELRKISIIAAHVVVVEQWLSSCWSGSETNDKGSLPLAPGPCLFRVVGLLDSFFSSSNATSGRDAAITETFKWVAIATAAQLNIEEGGESSETERRKDHNREFAAAARQRAKTMVFMNIAATRSFRLALALVLWGSISPTRECVSSNSTERRSQEDDAAFAVCEGVRRLRSLCKQARNIVCQKPEDLARQSQSRQYRTAQTTDGALPHTELLLELLGAVEWLAGIYNSVAIGLSSGRICPFTPQADSMSEMVEINPACNSSHLESLDIEEAAGIYLGNTAARSVISQPELEASILKRAAQIKDVPFIEQWCNASNEYERENVIHASRSCIAVAALIWRYLASFTLAAEAIGNNSEAVLYNKLHSHYTAMNGLIDLWRIIFGRLNDGVASHLQALPRKSWLVIASCVMDTETAILLFRQRVQKLVSYLGEKPFDSGNDEKRDYLRCVLDSTSSACARHGLLGAGQIAVISSTCVNGTPKSSSVSSSARWHCATYSRYMSAHPVSPPYHQCIVTTIKTGDQSPWLMVKAHALAVQAYSEEISASIQLSEANAENVRELTVGLNTCLKGLQELQNIVITS